MELHLKGKKALITGSNNGIGEAIAIAMAQEGAHVMVHGRDPIDLNRVCAHIEKLGGNVAMVQGDLSDEAEAKNVATKTLEALGGLDILVNNAGSFSERSWKNCTPANWIQSYNINLVSMVRMIEAFLPLMKQQKWGRIIQTASVFGINPPARMPDYSASKAAIINMTISLSKEVIGSGITVNSVSPGPVMTAHVTALLQNLAKEKGWGTDMKTIEKYAAEEIVPTPIGRFARPEEIANLVVYLCSPLADFITGTDFKIDGGYSNQ